MSSPKILFFLLFPVFLLCCKKDPRVLGVGVQPSIDELNASDTTVPVYAFTQKYDSVLTFKTGFKFLGTHQDPQFGRVDAGLYLNANLNLTGVSFGQSTIASAEIVLAVDISNYSGNLNSQLTYTVFDLDSALMPARVYFTSNKRLHNSNKVLTAAYTGTYSIFKDKPAIRIPIDLGYAAQILKDSANLVNNNVFQSVYKGFYITTSAAPGTEGVIYKINPEADVSGFYLSFKKTPSSADTAFRFSFSGASSVKFNTISHDLSLADASLKSQLAGDPSGGSDKLFLKGMGLARLKVQIPFLKNFSDSATIAVNRAEVSFNLDPLLSPGSTGYAPPPFLALLPLDSLGKETMSLDQKNSTDLARYNGAYNSDTKRYVFNIARHAQAIVKGQIKNYGFHLVVANPSPVSVIYRDEYMEGVILQGFYRNKPQLNLIYTKFKHD